MSPTTRLLTMVYVACISSHMQAQQVTLVNIIPAGASGESFQDSEPTLAVHPTDTQKIAASVMSNDRSGGILAPIYVSTNGGSTWAQNFVIPVAANATYSFVDPSLTFSRTNVLYAAMLRSSALGPNVRPLSIMRKTSYSASSPRFSEIAGASRQGVDQPHAQSLAVPVSTTLRDLVFVGSDDYLIDDLELGRTATVDQYDFTVDKMRRRRIEQRETSDRDGAPIRVAIHAASRRSYAAFLARRRSSPACSSASETDVTIVRDDSTGSGQRTFTSLSEPASGDQKVGIRVARSVLLPKDLELGRERFGFDLAIAVDPANSARVYLAWADQQGCGTTAIYRLHLRRSDDGGSTWTQDLGTARTNAKNPSLAVNTDGTVAFLYQQLTGTGTAQRWETRVQLGTNFFANITTLVLARPLVTDAPDVYLPYLGDYTQVLAIGRTFYGIFAAGNKPDTNNFPHSVTYRRAANWTTRQLLNTAGKPLSGYSMDPFFFKIAP